MGCIQAKVIDQGPNHKLTRVTHWPDSRIAKYADTYCATVMLDSIAVASQPYRRKRDAMDWIVLALIILRETSPRERYAMAQRMGVVHVMANASSPSAAVDLLGQGEIPAVGL